VENAIEKYLHDRVKELGGEHRRIAWIGRRDAPDDLILLRGRSFYVECKRPGEKPRPGQEREHARLRAAGIQVHVVSTFAEIDELLPKEKQ
jgi:hypothetical protein